ncbi:MAG TPA: 3'-5' exonuclease [Burkholderiales bacterium]|nr:3'-5' exonuclease [Burkholderiales bacterium]
MSPVLVFDIETIPDTDGFRMLRDLPTDMAAADVAEQAFEERREKTGNDFLPLHLHRIAAISCVLRDRDSFRVWSLGDANDPEKTLIQRFFDGVEKYSPQLVSWNGSGFDLPVLNYRGLRHSVHAGRFWDMGEDDREFKWNNYISRYHARHLDLMDLLAMYQPRASAPLDEMSQLLGFPGKIGMSGGKVWDKFQAGQIDAIRAYCETDVVNTYLVYLRFQLMRGVFDETRYDKECALVRSTLQQSSGSHWGEFLDAWPV